ncbi:HAD family phosphatase [Candidatus Woesearchaeota archaeon]|nr:HAD family phosphatase [Candidatus Woesearchaeota archaeon]
MGVELLIMDYDGSMVNMEPLRRKFFYQLCEKHGKPDPAEVIDKTYNTDIGFCIYRMMGFDLYKDMKNIWREFIEFFNENHAPMFPGTENLLKKVKEKDKKIAIASGNSIEIIHPFLQRNNLENLFSMITTGEDSESKKVLLKKCADTLRIKDYSKVLSVGDTKSDILAAQQLGMHHIAIGYGGFCSRELLEELETEELVLSPEELPQAVDNYL